jgi:hypothetical protein
MLGDTTMNVNNANVNVSGRVLTRTGAGLGGVSVCARVGVCTVTNPQGYYLLVVPDNANVNLWAFTVKPKLTGKTFSPSYRPISPTYGKSSKNFIAIP